MTNLLISIIIPTFNRAHLIQETLDSILNQTYTNWECIVIDDGSDDNTQEILKKYIQQDSRFLFRNRPENRPKGANSCRNFGFEISKGELIKWFDSDDIMLPNHIEMAYKTLMNYKFDFVITDTLNFDNTTHEILGEQFNFDKETAVMTPENFALNKIGWMTVDFLGTRKIVENIKFNEEIFYGDEYNFFIKLLHQTYNGYFINQTATHRRIHEDSITTKSIENEIEYKVVIANLKFQTAQDLIFYKNKNLIRWFLSGYMRYAFEIVEKDRAIPHCFSAFKLICKYYSIPKGIAFLTALASGKYFNKGYQIMQYARK